jgi:Arc/MetJ family transcription regulator
MPSGKRAEPDGTGEGGAFGPPFSIGDAKMRVVDAKMPPTYDGRMRTTVRIDDDLFRRAKARAAVNGQTVGELIEDALREALRPRARAAADLEPLPTFGRKGLLPGVDLSDNASTRDRLDEGVALDALR